jgi:DNA phosphorothioation-dependent restriction protein DptH
MENIKTLYYERFIQHIVESYSDKLKAAKPGHCMKITGLAMKELRVLLPLLRPINADMEVYILSEDEKGDEFIHATKLIELRNDPEKAVLILVPSNSRTSAEDSYGDATFQNLSAADLQDSFVWKLIDELPEEKKYLWKQMMELVDELNPSRTTITNYLLYLELNQYKDEAWGNGLYLFGMLPDKGLIKDDASIRRRFMINLDKVSSILSDFSLTAADRIAGLPLKKNSVQKDLMAFLSSEAGIEDNISLYENIVEKHPEFNYASMPWVLPGNSGPVKVNVDLVIGNDPKKELVRDAGTGDFILSIPEEKKGKIRFTITTDPAPKENPDIYSFEIALVNIDDFTEVGIVKKAKVGTNKRAKRTLSLNIPNGMFDDGEYMLRVRAMDENGIVLDTKKEFKEARVQAAWQEAYEQNPNLQIEQYRLEHHVAYCNESDVFTIDNTGEIGGEGEIDKRAKVNSITQAIIHYRSMHLAKDEDLEIPKDGVDRNIWIEGTLNSTYQFDFGPAYAYQIQLSKKLMQLEKTFLNNEETFGHVEAYLSGNPTDTTLLDPTDTARREPKFIPADNLNVPDELSALRSELFNLIKGSVDNDCGLTCTLDFTQNMGAIKNYLSEYEQWLRNIQDANLSEEQIICIQNLDTVGLTVEMPDGTKTDIKLISPLHPLRLAWMVNLYELYEDWEGKTLENPKYRKAWYRKLDKLFQGTIPMDIAPLVLSDSSMQEAYQYIGELTFGWGTYAQPTFGQEEAFASGYRQLKSYTATLLNVAREKRIDSDVSLDLVVRHIFNYALSHPYTDKLVINLFNAGDAAIFAKALVEVEKRGLGKDLTYELRLFSDDNMLQSGESLKDLLAPDSVIAPEAEVFSQASANRLFPKLRFSLNKISDFINDHDQYQAHLSFLVNPFAVHTELVRPDELSRSFYLNGTICRDVVSASQEGKSFVWNRYYSNKIMPNPVSESANLEVSLFARIQETTGKLLSSTLEESVPATTLRLKENDMMLLSFIHDSSDWVITFDKNMGPEFYDLPCLGENDIPYLLDYVPGEEATGVSSYLTTKPTSEISALMVPLFHQYGINLERYENFKQILEDVRSVSSSLIMQVNATSRKGFEVIGTTLCKRFLEKKHITKESFLIPIDLHKELFVDLDNENKERADNLVVKIDPVKKEILFTVVEIKCRNAHYNAEELHAKIVNQIENTIFALRSHFEIAVDGNDRLDRELKTIELKSLLEFYIRRSMRYGQLNPECAHEYLLFLSKLADGYDIRFKQLGVIFDFTQQERQKKNYYGDALIYTMGEPVIGDILNTDATLNTQVLEAMDKDFVDFFEPTFAIHTESVNVHVPVEHMEDSAPAVENVQHDDSEYEIIIPKNPTEKKSEIEQPVSVTSQPSVSFAPETKNEDKQQEEAAHTDTEEQPIVETSVENEELSIQHTDEPVDPNYKEPICDVIIGKNSESPQFGILGKMISNGRVIGLDLNECNTISLFGVQGAGKSYTIGSITEMVLRQFSKVNKLPAPMASVIFHYSDSMDYAPEFTSMVYPNDEAGQLAKLKTEYGAEPGNIKDVVLLAPESQVETRKAEYPDIEVYSIGFDSSELAVRDWMFLLGAMGNDSTYIKELKQIMKACRHNMSLQNIRNGVAESDHMSSSQRSLAEQKLDFAEEYITDGNKLQQYLKPGRLIIVDLRDEFIEKDEALGLFVVMLNIFSSVMQIDGKAFNKFIVFDEAHKYMNNKELVGSITTAIREMRHKGVSIMIASQDPMSLPTEIIELSSIVVMHRFSSPAWVKHVQKAITPLQTLTATEMAALGSGEAFLWANKASDKMITQRPIKISIRPRVTKHGGDTIQAVK